MGDLIIMAEGATLDWGTVAGAFQNVWQMVTSATEYIISNSVFLTLFAAGIIPVGFKIFKKAKRAVK